MFLLFVPFFFFFFFALRAHPLHAADGGLKGSRVIRMRIRHAHHAVRRLIGFALVHVVHRTDAQFGLEQTAGQQALGGAIADRPLQTQETIDAAIGALTLLGALRGRLGVRCFHDR
ncbi:MAG: hypothetical protein V3T84_01370 [Phycisphaerales bacterium]